MCHFTFQIELRKASKGHLPFLCWWAFSPRPNLIQTDSFIGQHGNTTTPIPALALEHARTYTLEPFQNPAPESS